MIDDPVLVNDWHPVASLEQLQEKAILNVRLLEEELVIWRAANGEIYVWQDLCLHRGTRLSLGKTDGSHLICPYHGWSYNTQGRCVRIPAHPDQIPPARAKVR